MKLVAPPPTVRDQINGRFLFTTEDHYWQVGQCIWSLLIASAGGWLARGPSSQIPRCEPTMTHPARSLRAG